MPTADEIKALLKVEDLRTRALIALLVYPGLRITEALTLTWSDVDHGNRTLTVMGKGSKPHSLRHANATLLIASGLSTEVGSKVLGHTDSRLASTVYVHLAESMSREASVAMDQVLAERAAGL